VFRHPQDKLPVAAVAALTCLDFGVYLNVDHVGMLCAYWLLMVIPKGVISAWNHHHQHSFTFRSPWLNRALEMSYAMHTGVTTHLWLLHHVLGHHVNYLDQTKDESRWQRKDGTRMGVLEYTLVVSATAYPRSFQVGRRHPKLQRTFVAFGLLTVTIATVLVWYRPLPGLFVFVLPMVCTLMFTAWVTYDHHAGLLTDDPFQASYNIPNRWFNVLTGNLGYHTAHHYKQGVHWSQLPALHETIKAKIPAQLYRKSTFDAALTVLEE
jgi:fatty acid desaturase